MDPEAAWRFPFSIMTGSRPEEPSDRAVRSIVRTVRDAPFDGAFVPADTAELAAAIQACRRCDLWRNATQGVAGEGPRQAALMLVGEQPGDQEDQAGKPFVGPAGRLLDRALAEAGIDREGVWVTNAVKHFKYERRGKRRLHAKPDAGEIDACRWWLDHELRLVRPKAVVAMGASAGRAVFGRSMVVARARGRPMPLKSGASGLLTVHPSYLLRLRDEADRHRAFDLLVEDLRAAKGLAQV
jgi:DNA polymerase